MGVATCGCEVAGSNAAPDCAASPFGRDGAPNFLREIAGSKRSKNSEPHKTRANATAIQARRRMTTPPVHSTPFQ